VRPLWGRAAARVLAGGDALLDRTVRSAGDASRTVKFLRGALAFVPRPDDVFIASYPRSGTTWTQLMVHLLVTGRRELAFEHISEVCPWWERSLALGTHSAEDFARLQSPRLFKTHLPYRWLPRGVRCIYLRRDPADVALSYYRLYGDYLRFSGSFDDFFACFLRGDLQYGSWFKHVEGWERHRDDPGVAVLDYEAMRADPTAAVRAIAAFLELPLSADRASQIVADSDIAVMKGNEPKFDHAGELHRSGGIRAGRFIGTGAVGRGRQELADHQRAALDAAHRQPILLPELEWRLPSFLH
jgi:hypothetical protein